MESTYQLATFGAGCFWGVEEAFRSLPGVIATQVGYVGGTLENPTYQDVCTDKTGHAEVVQIEFDPAKIGFAELVKTFLEVHDPTQLNRQGPDFGTQYRSAVFFHSAEQEAIARDVIHAARASHSKPIVTEVTPASVFYPAEEYHQKYLMKRGLGSCHI